MSSWDERMGEVMDGYLGRPFDLVLGRTTYDIFAAHRLRVEGEDGRPLHGATTYVASRGRPQPELGHLGPPRGGRRGGDRGARALE